MSNKTLGQIAHDAGVSAGGWSRQWAHMSEGQRAEWENIAQAVVAAYDEFATLRAKLAAAEARAEEADVLTDDMLRYAMAALGTNSPADADLYRAFWFHAITMRQSQRKLSKGEAK